MIGYVTIRVNYYILSQIFYKKNWWLSVSEALLESIPQTHILFVLAVREPGLIIGDGFSTTLFWTTFASSLFSASFAMANFLKRGPCRLVKNEGCLGGFMESGFICLFINIVATIMMKGLNLAFSLGILGNGEEGIYWRPAYWFLLHVMPQFFYVSYFQLSFSWWTSQNGTNPQYLDRQK